MMQGVSPVLFSCMLFGRTTATKTGGFLLARSAGKRIPGALAANGCAVLRPQIVLEALSGFFYNFCIRP